MSIVNLMPVSSVPFAASQAVGSVGSGTCTQVISGCTPGPTLGASSALYQSRRFLPVGTRPPFGSLATATLISWRLAPTKSAPCCRSWPTRGNLPP